MSQPTPSTPSSSSEGSSQRPPYGQSKSDANKLAIRVVPYSPPKLEAEASSSQAPGGGGEAGDDFHLHGVEQPASASASRIGASARQPDLGPRSESHFSAPGSSATSLAKVKGKGVSALDPGSDLSDAELSTTPIPAHNANEYSSSNIIISQPNASSQPVQHDARSSALASPSRRNRFISVHSDKTFSIVLKPTGRDTGASGSHLWSEPTSNISTASSRVPDRISFDVQTDDTPSTPPSSYLERSVSPFPSGSSASEETTETVTQSAISPWNYRMVAGLRKVEDSPDVKGKGKESDDITISSLTTLPVELPPLGEPSSLAAKPSFNSESSGQTASTIEETANYKVIGRSSPPRLDSEGFEEPPSPSHSNNYSVIGRSSPPPPPFDSSPPKQLLESPGSRNYVVYDNPTPSVPATPSRKTRPNYSDDSLLSPGSKNIVVYDDSTQSTVATFPQRPRLQLSDDSHLHAHYSQESPTLSEQYSQESLLVPPLRPHRRTLSGTIDNSRHESRESLRPRAHSFSSISSVLTHDEASNSFASTPNVVRLGSTPSTSSLQQSSWAPPRNSRQSQSQSRAGMEARPHVWSSQLSTVMSEDESSRHLSVSTVTDSRSSRRGSAHSRQMLSISSWAEPLTEVSNSPSGRSRSTSSVDRPNAAYNRAGREPSGPLIRDLDENGDGLADLRHLQHKSSRPRISNPLSRKASNQSIQSSASSRAGSFLASSFPAWARLYYGSGERSWTGTSIRSYTDDSRPASSFVPDGSPAMDYAPIFSPRKRPRDIQSQPIPPVSREATPQRPVTTGAFTRTLRKMTSSTWSPHLRQDRRASAYTIWHPPPSTTWSQDKGLFGRRNIQVVMFTLGFVFPLAWITAAFLPLPRKTYVEMSERDHGSTAMFGIPEDEEAGAHDDDHRRRTVSSIDDLQYQSAKWWRIMNRLMSVFGVAIIVAVIVLVVVGTRDWNWS